MSEDRRKRRTDLSSRPGCAWGAATDAGRVRSANEDSWLVDFPLFAVADGMGGHAAGEVASRLALDTLRTSVTDHTLESLVAAVKVANARVFEMSRTDNAMRGMGTTLCAVALVMIESHERLAVVNVGDSRVYVLQDGALVQVTEDHSLVESMVRQGTLTHEEAKVHPQRNILTRALGIDGDVGVDSWEVEPVSGDRYLLCSDGLFNEVPDETHRRACCSTPTTPTRPRACSSRLANEGGGRDNITVVIVDVVEGLDPSEAMPVEETVGLEAFDPNATAAITPVGDWLDEASPEPSENDLPPPLPPPFHTDAELDDIDDTDDPSASSSERRRERTSRGAPASSPSRSHGRRHRRRRRRLVRRGHLLRRLRPRHGDHLQGAARRRAVVPTDGREALRPPTWRRAGGQAERDRRRQAPIRPRLTPTPTSTSLKDEADDPRRRTR